MCGNDQFHVFCTSERDNDQLGCILKVADHKDHKGDWCYEDFERVKKEDVPDYVTHLKFDIRMQMEKAGIIERSWKNAE